MKKQSTDGIAAVPTTWQDVILVCGKCSKKLDGGFGPDGDHSLARALKHELRSMGRRRTARVIGTKCLGLCPKGAVTVLPGGQPGAMLTVPGRTHPAALLARIDAPTKGPSHSADLL